MCERKRKREREIDRERACACNCVKVCMKRCLCIITSMTAYEVPKSVQAVCLSSAEFVLV